MHFRNLALALPLIAVTSASAGTVPTPLDFGKLFCEASLAGNMAAIEAEMSPDLALEVAEAEAKNAQAAASFPDEKPPLGDGLPWRSWQDHADGCDVGAIRMDKSNALVKINYSFKDQPDASYSDKLVLVPSVNDPGTWELSDIHLIDNQTMRSFLASAFAPPPTD